MTKTLTEPLEQVLTRNTDWLVDRILHYAKAFGYTKYTSTLREAWFLSIRGLTESLIAGLRVGASLDLVVDEPLTNDPLCNFGVMEARKHRERGIRPSLFLAFMSYYEQSYHDLAATFLPLESDRAAAQQFIRRAFARIQASLLQEWESLADDTHLRELQASNRFMTNEKNRYLTAFESLFSPSLIFDADLHLVHANHAAVKIAQPDATPGATYYGRSDIEEFFKAWLMPHVKDFHAGSVNSHITRFQTTLHNHPHHYILFLTRMLDESEKFADVIATLLDITEEVQTAREHEELQSRFFHTAKLASLGTLVAGIAHEINNPLTILRTSFELLHDASHSGNLTPELLEKRIDQQLKALQRIVNIVSGLNSYVHKESDEKRPILFDNCIQDTIALCEQLFCKRRIEVTVSLKTNELMVAAVPGRLSQFVMNLLSNAADAIESTGNAGRIVIETHQESNSIVMTLSDTGCGMSEEVRDRIFDPFFTTKTVGKGMGLGLSITQAIIADCGGSIEVDSKLGLGTTLRILLPILERPLSDAVHEGERKPAPCVNISRSARILLIDDEMEICGAMGELLHSDGHQVATAASAEEGLELIRYRPFDLVITDLKMPHMNGIEFLRLLDCRYPKLPVIVMTGCLLNEFSDGDQSFLHERTITVLRKPATRNEMRSAIIEGLQ